MIDNLKNIIIVVLQNILDIQEDNFLSQSDPKSNPVIDQTIPDSNSNDDDNSDKKKIILKILLLIVLLILGVGIIYLYIYFPGEELPQNLSIGQLLTQLQSLISIQQYEELLLVLDEMQKNPNKIKAGIQLLHIIKLIINVKDETKKSQVDKILEQIIKYFEGESK